MITVQVTYQVEPSYVEENMNNITGFLADFKNKKDTKFLYHVYVKDDGVTFVHIAMYENSGIQKELLALPSFLKFQQQRDEKGIVGEAVIENLQHLGSSLGLVS